MFEVPYAGVFRYLSGFTHAARAAIYCLVEDTPKERVVILESTTGPQRGVSFAPLTFALILFVASETFACPRAGDVHGVVSKHGPGLLAEPRRMVAASPTAAQPASTASSVPSPRTEPASTIGVTADGSTSASTCVAS